MSYNGSIVSSGGVGPYSWNVVGLSDNLGWNTSNNGDTLNIYGTPNTATGDSPVSFRRRSRTRQTSPSVLTPTPSQ